RARSVDIGVRLPATSGQPTAPTPASTCLPWHVHPSLGPPAGHVSLWQKKHNHWGPMFLDQPNPETPSSSAWERRSRGSASSPITDAKQSFVSCVPKLRLGTRGGDRYYPVDADSIKRLPAWHCTVLRLVRTS